jgi:SAM-dependent methyltransferase
MDSPDANPDLVKADVQQYWQATPCGTEESQSTDEFQRYLDLEAYSEQMEPFIPRFADFHGCRGKRVLEVGVGAGTDHLHFARAGAVLSGVDLTDAATDITARRLEAEGFQSDLRTGDAEALPFPDDQFDVVYSWGVIHHTPGTKQAAREILRVLRPGGRFCVMVYNLNSLVAAQAWLVYGAARGRPQKSRLELIAEHMESAGTKAFSSRDALDLFPVADAKVETVVTGYDMRIGRRRFLPTWTRKLVPHQLGWFHVLSGTK